MSGASGISMCWTVYTPLLPALPTAQGPSALRADHTSVDAPRPVGLRSADPLACWQPYPDSATTRAPYMVVHLRSRLSAGRHGDQQRVTVSRTCDGVTEPRGRAHRVSEVPFSEDENLNMPVQTYELPDGSTVDIGVERFKIPEILFNPVRPPLLPLAEPAVRGPVVSEVAVSELAVLELAASEPADVDTTC